jgi:hypothetical protein
MSMPMCRDRQRRRWPTAPTIVAVGLSAGLLISFGSEPTATAARHVTADRVSGTTPVTLDGWRLTLPVNSGGGTDGSPEVLNPAALYPPYLDRAADGSLDFWAPTIGATTSHSSSPRTELVANSGFTAGTSGPHTLTATVTITQVPATSQTIIIGQIHGDGSLTSDPYVLLYYSNGTLHAQVNQQLASGNNYLDYPLLTDIALGTTFSYTITDLGDGTDRFTATANGSTQQKTAPVPSAWSDQTVRFQAGDYEKLKGDPADGDGGKLTFSVLTAS